MYGGGKRGNRRRGAVGRGPVPTAGASSSAAAASSQHQQHHTNNPTGGSPQPSSPPMALSAGLPIPFVEVIPWFIISVACYFAFLLLPGRLSSPRSRLTLIGGNEFVNVASHLHFCVWIWPLHDFVFRVLGILLFPPKRAAVFFTSMFFTTDGSSGGFIAMILRSIRVLLVQPATNTEGYELDIVDEKTYKPHDFKTHGSVPRGSTYWSYRSVAILSYFAMFFIWLGITYLYHTRHVIGEKAEHEQRKKARKDTKAKKEARTKLNEKLKSEGGLGATIAEEIESETANLAEDEFSDEDVDYDPYGRAVPDPPYIPTVSWMVLWSLCFSSGFVWVNGMPILTGQLFPIGCCVVLAFCVLMPQ